jgi:hypothetical protein
MMVQHLLIKDLVKQQATKEPTKNEVQHADDHETKPNPLTHVKTNPFMKQAMTNISSYNGKSSDPEPLDNFISRIKALHAVSELLEVQKLFQARTKLTGLADQYLTQLESNETVPSTFDELIQLLKDKFLDSIIQRTSISDKQAQLLSIPPH